MSTTADNPTRNGVDTATLFATLDAVKGNNEIAKFQFRATNKWISGTHNQSTIHGFYGAMQEMSTPAAVHVFDADHPAVLVGADNGPTPVEYLLHALAACLTAGIANIAAARGVNLTEVESTVEGDIDLLGILGLSDEVRNGYQQIKVSFKLRGDDPDEAAPGRRAVAPALGRLRRPHQRRARRDRRRRRLTTGSHIASSARDGMALAGRTRPAPPVPIDRSTTMHTTDTLIIGAGQAGLAMSRCLTDARPSTTWCSSAAASPSAGAASAGTPCACSPRTG